MVFCNIGGNFLLVMCGCYASHDQLCMGIFYVMHARVSPRLYILYLFLLIMYEKIFKLYFASLCLRGCATLLWCQNKTSPALPLLLHLLHLPFFSSLMDSQEYAQYNVSSNKSDDPLSPFSSFITSTILDWS